MQVVSHRPWLLIRLLGYLDSATERTVVSNESGGSSRTGRNVGGEDGKTDA